MQLEDYTTGTVSISNGSTALTGSGTAWSVADLKEGDTFYKDGYAILIASVDSDTGITLADAWPGTVLSGASYVIRYQPDNSRMQGTTRQLLDELRQGIWLTPDATGKTADRATYDARPAGFRFLDVSVDPFKLYVKESDTSGNWSAGADWVGPKGDDGSSDVVGTSTTSLAIATGSKTFAITEVKRGWGVGARLRASSDADGANWMEGIVTSYASDGLTLSVDLVGGSGTFADWTINLAGSPGDISSADTDASSFGFGIDEDDMASDDPTKFPYQANVKAFVEAYAGPSAAWDGATAYVAGDKVSYNGAIWQANAPNTNAEPGVATEWDEYIPPFVGGTLTDQLVLAASTASAAGLVLTDGAAPTSPSEGELWRSGTFTQIRISGATYDFAFSNAANEWTQVQKFSGAIRRKTGSLVLANGINVGPTLPAEPFVRITGPTAAFSIASLTGIYQGQTVTLYNTTSQTMTVKHQDSADEATAFKRFITPTGADITATVVTVIQDETAGRWIVVAYH